MWGCNTGELWPVCSKPEGNTAQGLCDMAGNVWELMLDAWHIDYVGAPDDGSAWTGAMESDRVARGGGFNNVEPLHLRAAYRHDFGYHSYSEAVGFRCVRDPQ
jgi:formylglycine-generating enzyme required for sulfatase activity